MLFSEQHLRGSLKSVRLGALHLCRVCVAVTRSALTGVEPTEEEVDSVGFSHTVLGILLTECSAPCREARGVNFLLRGAALQRGSFTDVARG